MLPKVYIHIHYSLCSAIYFKYVYVNTYKYIYSYMYVYIFENMLTHLNEHLFDGYFFWVLDLFMCGKQKSIFVVRKMKSSHSRCRKLDYAIDNFTTQQTALLHSKRFYCTAENFIAQQKALLHSRKFNCITEDFITQQKV